MSLNYRVSGLTLKDRLRSSDTQKELRTISPSCWKWVWVSHQDASHMLSFGGIPNVSKRRWMNGWKNLVLPSSNSNIVI